MSAPVVVQNPSDGGLAFWLVRLFAFGCLVAGVAAIFAMWTTALIVRGRTPLPDWRNFATDVASISRLYAADGTLLGEWADEYREIVPLERIPAHIVNAVLAIEDRNYYEHGGISYRGILRAAWANVAAQTYQQGGSTITQQVIKQYAGGDKTLQRKMREAIMARELEVRYSKAAILSVYLNKIAFGAKAFGVAAAAKRYFQKTLNELTLAEAALIAGLPQAPSAYSPLEHPARALRRRNTVLDAMLKYGYANPLEVAFAKVSPVVVRPWQDVYLERMPYYAADVRRTVVDGFDPKLRQGLRIEAAADPSFEAAAQDSVDYAARNQDRRQGWRGPEARLRSAAQRTVFVERQAALYGEAELAAGRRYLALVESVDTTKAMVRIGGRVLALPLENMQWAARWFPGTYAENDRQITAATAALRTHDVIWVERATRARGKFRGYQVSVNPAWLPEQDTAWDRANTNVVRLAQAPYPQAAIFAADHRTGYVMAMGGGSDFRRSQFNRAVDACRQPGSTYKPIYYSLALQEGYGFDTRLNDLPITIVDPVTGATWTPTNLHDTLDGDVTLEYALVFSKNLPSLDLFKRLGAKQVEAWARKLGFTTEIHADDALALGASCTTMPQLAGAFGVFARDGKWFARAGEQRRWVTVRRVFDRDGKLLEDHTVAADPYIASGDRWDRLAVNAGIAADVAVTPRAAYLTNKLLAQMVTSGFTKMIKQTGIEAAGKTGTSSDTHDTWFLGYTDRILTVAWLGDDKKKRALGRHDAAYMIAIPLWARFMAAAAHQYPQTKMPWSVPSGVRATDRGAHTKGEKVEPMDLIYRSHDAPQDGVPGTSSTGTPVAAHSAAPKPKT